MLGSIDSNSGEWPQDFLCFLCYFSGEHKLLFIPIGLCFMKRHVWRFSYFFFHKTVNNDWNLFNLSEQSLENSVENSRKFRFSNFHLENSRTWIFILWNHILQSRTLLLQPILVYTYIYNNPSLGCNNICLTWLISYHA